MPLRQGNASTQHWSGTCQRKPSQTKDESKNIFPDFFFFLTAVSGCNWARTFKRKIKTTAQHKALLNPLLIALKCQKDTCLRMVLPSPNPPGPTVILPLSLSHSIHAPCLSMRAQHWNSFTVCSENFWPDQEPGWEGASPPLMICFSELTAELCN